ncbi:MAG: DUF1572 domain-containing protein [Armatimonadetes bacterium]|nr:DUF1572 domain-containing protein [Armatimonadota bacterium]
MKSILEVAKQLIRNQAETLIKDSGYIPAEKLFWCALGCAKTAADILKEIACSNIQMAASIRGETPGKFEEEFVDRVGKASTLTELGQLVKDSADIVCRAIDNHSEADLEKQITMPWGAVFPLYEAIFLPANHMTYHDGQINYIQLLLGDSKFHWAES